MLAVKILKNIAGCVLLLAAAAANAGEYERVLNQLNEEQRRLLGDYHQPTSMAYNTHSLGSNVGKQVSLVSFQITADTNLMQGASVELGARYRSWGINSNFSGLTYNTYSTQFVLKAPIQKALDFTDSIREQSELCPEKLIDKMVIDGAVSLNFTW